MRGSRSLCIAGLAVGASAFAIMTLSPAQAQERPESLLPPGFEQPAKKPDPAPPTSSGGSQGGGSQGGGQTGGGQTGGQGSTPKPPAAKPPVSSTGGQPSGGGTVFVPGTGEVPDVELTMPIPGRPSRPSSESGSTKDVAKADADKEKEADDPDAELAGLTPTTFDVPAAAARSSLL